MRNALKIASLVGILVVFGGSPLMAANEVAVTGAAAIEGSYGMEITLDGASTGLAYVEDQSPTAETVYRVQFWVDHNTPSMANKETLNLFKGLQDAGDKKNINVKLKKSKTGLNFIVYTFVRNDSSSFQLVGKGMQFKDKPTGIMIEWQAASAPGANDGFIKVYKMTATATNLKNQIIGLDNDTKIIEKARLGIASVPPTGATATLYFDSFESYRTLAP